MRSRAEGWTPRECPAVAGPRDTSWKAGDLRLSRIIPAGVGNVAPRLPDSPPWTAGGDSRVGGGSANCP